MKDLTLFDPGLPMAPGHTLTPVSLQLPTDLTAPQWQEVGAALQRVDEARQWWLGDWWNAGVQWGEGQRVCQELGLAYETTRHAGQVARCIEFVRRRTNLTFTHHTEVCVIDEPDVQDRFLLWCEEPLEHTGKPRSTRELREAIKDYLDNLNWSPFERERRRWVEELGFPTLANQHADPHLLRWAKMSGRHVYIGRGSKWGNPFELGKDGDRATVIDAYDQHYLPFKPSLTAALSELDGKVLECYCVPEPCHGEALIDAVEQHVGYCPGRGLTPWQLLIIYMGKSGLRHSEEPIEETTPLEDLWKVASCKVTT